MTGSLFNHSESPNVSFAIDTETDSIRYTTSRDVPPDEELCIFYGHTLWFQPADSRPNSDTLVEPEDGWGGLTSLCEENAELKTDPWPVLNGNLNEIIPEDQLPFQRLKLTPDEDEEEDMSVVRTGWSFPSLCFLRITLHTI